MEDFMKKQFSLKWKILLIFFSITVVMISSILTVSVYLNTKNVKTLAKNNMDEITNEALETLNLYFTEKSLQLKALARNPDVINYVLTGENREDVLNILETEFNQYGQFENYFITDKNGITLLDGVGGASIDLDITGYPFWRLSEDRDEFHLDEIVYKSPITGELVTVAGTRIEDENGNFIGLIGMPIFWEKFIDTYMSNSNKKLGETGYIYILDKNMTVIAHKDKSLLLTDFSKYDFAKKEYEADQGFQRYYFDAQKKWKYMSFGTFEINGWKIAIVIDEDEFLSEIKKARNIMIGLGLLIFVFGSIFILLFINKVSTVIKTITIGTDKLSIGDFKMEDMDWDFINKINSRNDELGKTGQSLGKLIEYFKEKVNIAEKIADGDLRVDVSISSEKDKLGQSLEKMVVSLNEMVRQVNVAVDQVASGSNQVAQASQALSQGATEQASSQEEMTSSITEINSQSKQNTDNAVEASGLANQSMQNANSGNVQMQKLVSAMNEINVSADEIKRIVTVIDDIAFQTNLLALNANVEAARAGKYGKGFAVVAEEVRNLASRSAESVKETTDMVEKTIKNITSGNELVETTASKLGDIINGASKVADLVEEISTASKEQSLGLEQINQGLGQIDQVTQSNTASAEESASAAEELAGQAQHLKAIVAKFKLKETNDEDLKNIKNKSSKVMNKIRDTITDDRYINNVTEDKNENIPNKRQPINENPKDIIKLDDDDFGKF
jgi:methyl-accepting chemotaxis protein